MFKSHLLTGLTATNGIYSLVVASASKAGAMLQIDSDIMVRAQTPEPVKAGDTVNVKLENDIVVFDSITKAPAKSAAKTGTQGCADGKRSTIETF